MMFIEICDEDYDRYQKEVDKRWDMTKYIEKYGWHFNQKLCQFATERMMKGGKQLQVIPKQNVDMLLDNYNISVDKSSWDYVYIANMCKADFYGSSIDSEKHLAMYIKDLMDDEDGYDGLVFNRWYADMVKLGVHIKWDEMM